jgi:hypothetical protein
LIYRGIIVVVIRLGVAEIGAVVVVGDVYVYVRIVGLLGFRCVVLVAGRVVVPVIG